MIWDHKLTDYIWATYLQNDFSRLIIFFCYNLFFSDGEKSKINSVTFRDVWEIFSYQNET